MGKSACWIAFNYHVGYCTHTPKNIQQLDNKYIFIQQSYAIVDLLQRFYLATVKKKLEITSTVWEKGALSCTHTTGVQMVKLEAIVPHADSIFPYLVSLLVLYNWKQVVRSAAPIQIHDHVHTTVHCQDYWPQYPIRKNLLQVAQKMMQTDFQGYYMHYDNAFT